MKKYILSLLMTTSVISGAAWAQAPANPPTTPPNEFSQLASDISSGISNGLSSLNTFIASSHTPGSLKHFLNAQDTAPTPNLQKIIATNTAQATLTFEKTITAETPAKNAGWFTIPAKEETTKTIISKTLPVANIAAKKAEIETSDNLHNTLSQFLYAMYQNDSNVIGKTGETGSLTTAQGGSFQQYMADNSLRALTEKTDAADTLYDVSEKGSVLTNASDQRVVAKPTVRNNDYFNFATLITPISYDTNQSIAAKQFIKYAAQSTQNMTTGIDFQKLYHNPTALLAVKRNPEYQVFQMTVRTLLAIRSVAINALNQLIEERTPVSGLGQAAGLSNEDSASPLQVEAYQANHRVENSNWYSNMENAPPATVLRQIAYMDAEREQMAFRAQLQREQILAALTALEMQSNLAATNSTLQQEAAKMKTVIDDASNTATESEDAKNAATDKATQAAEAAAEAGVATSDKKK